MELNFNWTKVNSSANLASWSHEEERELRPVTAHNMMEYDDIFGKNTNRGVQEWFADMNLFSMHGSLLSIQEV
jgi:hypothetical protein